MSYKDKNLKQKQWPAFEQLPASSNLKITEVSHIFEQKVVTYLEKIG